MMAARLHGFRRTNADIIHVVRVSDSTLNKRVSEFLRTESATLTVNQFGGDKELDVREADPPCYVCQRDDCFSKTFDFLSSNFENFVSLRL
jgi:transcription factor IIIB 90 kDa subunit